MKYLRPAIAFTLFFIVVTGLAFPALIWGVSQAVFPHQANGSLIKGAQGKVVGSELLGQNFADSKYFHPRPSAAGSGYDAANSSGTNLGPSSDKLINGIADDPKTEADESYSGVKQLAEAYRKENELASDTKLPSDAVTRSASGLDPHISLENAKMQVKRIAKARGIQEERVLQVIAQCSEDRFLGIYGEPRVNVLRANLALNALN